MTHEEKVRAKIKALEDMLPTAKAADQGAKVERYSKPFAEWHDTDPEWHPGEQYRIKPEPPLESWAVKQTRGIVHFGSEHAAIDYANIHGYPAPVLMREVRE